MPKTIVKPYSASEYARMLKTMKAVAEKYPDAWNEIDIFRISTCEQDNDSDIYLLKRCGENMFAFYSTTNKSEPEDAEEISIKGLAKLMQTYDYQVSGGISPEKLTERFLEKIKGPLTEHETKKAGIGAIVDKELEQIKQKLSN